MNISMYCDLEAGPGTPAMVAGQAVEKEKCKYELEWYSQYACPQCTSSDMELIEGECTVLGTRSINVIWREPKTCYGGPELPKVSHENCMQMSLDKNKVAMIVFGAAVLFSLLTALLICLYVRNRKIYREYSVLKEQNEADIELERYTLDDEDA
jgi:hypothetical protein